MRHVWQCCSFLILLAYGSMLAQPFLPYLNYSLHKDYISENLCVNRMHPEMHCEGKCFLQKEIVKTTTQEQKTNTEKLPPLQSVSVHINPFALLFSSLRHTIQLPFPQERNIQFALLFTLIPHAPPESSFA